MGAWGVGTFDFDNDTACDWTYELENVDDLSLVKDTLSQAVNDENEDFLDADIGSNVLAACEVIVRLQAKWGTRNSYTEAVDKWVESHPVTVPVDLVKFAETAIDRVLGEKSEL